MLGQAGIKTCVRVHKDRHTRTHLYMIRIGYACQDSFPSVPESTEVQSTQPTELSLCNEKAVCNRERGEAGGTKTQSNKARRSPKLQKLIGHTNVDLHLHPACALGSLSKKLDGSSLPKKRHKNYF